MPDPVRKPHDDRSSRETLAAEMEDAPNVEMTSPALVRYARVLRRSLSGSVWLAVRDWFVRNASAPAWVPRRLRTPAASYLVAILLQVVVAGVELALSFSLPVFEFARLPLALVVVVVALNWGMGPSLVATLVGTFLLYYAVLLPNVDWSFTTGERVGGIVLLLVLGLTITLLSNRQQQARRQAEALAREAEHARQRAEALAASLMLERAQSERERQRLQTVLDVLPAGVGIADAQGRFLMVNPSMLDIWGKVPPISGVSDYGMFKGWWPDGRPVAAEEWAMARALRGEACPGDEVEIESFDGQRKVTLKSAAPIRDEAGGVVGGIVAMIDITERKRLEDALRRSEQEAAARARELEAIFAAMADGVMVFDREGTIQQVNPAMYEIFGVDATSDFFTTCSLQARKRLLMLRDERGQALTDDQLPVVRVLRGEVHKGPSEMSLLVRRLDGRDAVVGVSGAPLHDSEGNIAGGVLVIRDVTEQRELAQRTQDALNTLLAMAEALVQFPEEPAPTGEPPSAADSPMMQRFAELTLNVLDCQRVGITVVDPNTGALHLVAGAGLSLEELRYWQQIVERANQESLQPSPAYGAAYSDNVTLVEAPAPQHPAHPYKRHTSLVAPMQVGERRVGLLSLSYTSAEHEYTAQERMLTGAIARLAALTLERERLLHEREAARARELALREANRQMDTFLGVASHELRTPLATMKLSVQIALRRMRELARRDERLGGTLAPFQELLERAMQHEMRLERLMQELLDASRIQSDRLELHMQVSDLCQIVRESVDEQRALVPERQLHLELSADEVVLVQADADRIGQVVTNYLTNALKYSPESAPVTVGLSVAADQACVWVRDQGPGLPLAEQARIWERFHRVEGIEVQSGTGVGLGLGLYICRTIIERHGGQVGVESMPGQGSTFWFFLPLAAPVS